MGLFDGRLRRIEALDLRPARPVEAEAAEAAVGQGEAHPCVDCGRLTRAGAVCSRCLIVHQVAQAAGATPATVWRALADSSWLLELLLDDGELRARVQRALSLAAALASREAAVEAGR
jgi:hypothetical protein